MVYHECTFFYVSIKEHALTIDDLKQIILKKDEAIQHFLMEINKYKCFNLHKVQSQVKNSVENKKIT